MNITISPCVISDRFAYSGLFRKASAEIEYLLITQEGIIEGVTEGLCRSLNTNSKQLNFLNINELAPEIGEIIQNLEDKIKEQVEKIIKLVLTEIEADKLIHGGKHQ